MLIHIIQHVLHVLHERIRLPEAAAIALDIARSQVLDEVDSAWRQRVPEVLERRLLLVHRVPAVVDDDVEVAAGLGDEAAQERDVGLVAREDGRLGRLVGPRRRARLVVLDVVQVDVREVLEPRVVRRARPVAHVAAEPDLEHLQVAVAQRLEACVVHVLVVVAGHLVGAVFEGDLVQRLSLSERPARVSSRDGLRSRLDFHFHIPVYSLES